MSAKSITLMSMISDPLIGFKQMRYQVKGIVEYFNEFICG